MSKIFWVILGLTVVALVGIVLVSNHKNSDSTQSNQNPQEITAEDHTEGNPSAKVTLVEYGDFQCPVCGAAFPLVKQLRQDYSDRVRFVFRNFPLTNIHPNAFSAARAAEAASGQNKFFEMHDLLYQNQDKWTQSTEVQKLFKDFAGQLGLNIDQFNDAYNSGTTTDKINSDIKEGKDISISATPTFYLNGQKIDPNPRSYDEFKAKIEAELAKNP